MSLHLLPDLKGPPKVTIPTRVFVPPNPSCTCTPTNVTFRGNQFRDSEAMLLARAYQEATGIVHVIVNGQVVISQGKQVEGSYPGKRILATTGK